MGDKDLKRCTRPMMMGFTSRPCGRKLKAPEQEAHGLCGIHLAAKRRREKSNQERRRREEARAAEVAKVKAQCDQLLGEYGLEARPHFWDFQPIGHVTVDPVALLQVLDSLRNGC